MHALSDTAALALPEPENSASFSSSTICCPSSRRWKTVPAYPGYIGGRDRREVEKRAAELLEMLGMEHRSSHKPAELSGGEQQRVAMAGALMISNAPAVLLADEPSGNLDTKNREEIHRLFFTLRDTVGHKTVVIVTHDGPLAAMSDTKDRNGRRTDRPLTASPPRI